MKFAKELEQDLVPEWRIKYLNYKAGKKYVKAVAKAINRAHGTPGLGRRGELPPHTTPRSYTISNTFSPRPANNNTSSDDGEDIDPLHRSPAPIARSKSPKAQKPQGTSKSISTRGERAALTRSPGAKPRYGSFVPSPPVHNPPSTAESRGDFELPAPALRVPSHVSEPVRKRPPLQESLSRFAIQRSASMAPATGPTRTLSPAPLNSTPSSSGQIPRQRIVRLFSMGSPLGRRESRVNIDMQNLDEVRERECEFFHFLDSELDKVETFYQQKENQAGERLAVLREQLHEMRNRRTEEITETKHRKEQSHFNGHHGEESSGSGNGTTGWVDPIKAKIFRPGPNSKALLRMARTPVMRGATTDERRDYVRRPIDDEVPYRTAKRKLKLALQEFYRGLELLKSYALLNRTAFRKLNKKYDKAVNAKPPYRYLNGKVNKSWFVNSDVLDGHIKTVEDLYARYFERGNHKIAAGKLRSHSRRPGDESASAFRNGLLIGVGLVFAVQGLVCGSELLFNAEPVVRLQTSYLLQIYAGYFLMLYLFILFCVDCHVWTANKINYPFIFELDPRNYLDWRQLAEFPSVFLLLLGVILWLNFANVGPSAMYLYWPVVLISLTFLILFFPAPILGHKARRWFLYSHWRLLLAGIYPVEFRDFFLGDIYCSLTYATCNLELFFCLYATYWANPVQCNSNHSRLLGFFSAMPGIWRALQCVRRYRDTGNVFPHLVNCGKYCMTIMAAVCLSLYRIEGSHSNLALFITFSTINSIYCSIWDIFMDMSLLQPNSRHFLLRDILALKRRWVYYAAMAADPILRFAWIFYAIFTFDLQHSTIVSFLVAFAEVNRRGFWTLLRVENEHCANVAQYKASRDVPLPYRIEPLIERLSLEQTPSGPFSTAEQAGVSPAAASGRSTGVDVTSAAARTPATPATVPEDGMPGPAAQDGTVRRRRADSLGGLAIRKLMAEAHKQDFEKKRLPDGSVKGSSIAEEDGDESDEEGYEDEDGDALEERLELREAETLSKRGQDEDISDS